MKMFVLNNKKFLFFIMFSLPFIFSTFSISYAQDCGIYAIGINGYQYCEFEVDHQYRLEVDVENKSADCEYGGYVQYACSVWVEKNGISVVQTNGFILDKKWSTWFPVTKGDYIKLNVVYETINIVCLGQPGDYSLHVYTSNYMGGGWPPNNNVENAVNMLYKFNLEQNYPNPFNPSTTINYSIPNDGFVKLAVYNILGEEVSTLVNNVQSAGNYSIDFNASELPSGIYLYRIDTQNLSLSKKLILTK